MKKEIILFHFNEKNFFIKEQEIKKFKKNYFKIILYNNNYQSKFNNHEYNSKKLNKIKDDYKKIKINLTLNKIYEINFFLKGIKLKNKNKKIYISPYFISNIILEEEFIFYELSKIYRMQFIRPESSFIKNRYLLAKNIFKQHYTLKKKTIFSKNEFDTLKLNYAASLETYSNLINPKKFKSYIYKILLNFLNFRFNKRPKKYVLAILNNNMNLNSLSKNMNLQNFTDRFLNKFNYELVFLLHPRTNIFKYFFREIKKKFFFIKRNHITFLQNPINLNKIILDSEFIIHLSSSLSAQTLFLNKKILNLGKNEIYIKNINNIVLNIRQSNLNFLKEKVKKNDILKIDKYLISLLSNSVNYKGEFNLYTKKLFYIFNEKRNEKKIIQNLLNAI